MQKIIRTLVRLLVIIVREVIVTLSGLLGK